MERRQGTKRRCHTLRSHWVHIVGKWNTVTHPCLRARHFTVNQTRKPEMLLKNKKAIIYGAGGSIGGLVARAFAREGATVYLVGCTLDKLDNVAK
jgi:FlaA1/EpsC-like NDP-sugar epimerase